MSSLAKRLAKDDARWRRRFDKLETQLSADLATAFGTITSEKAQIIAYWLGNLEVSDTGVIVHNQANQDRIMRMLVDIEKIDTAAFTRGGKVDSLLEPTMGDAARRGITKALDAIRAGDQGAVPKGYRGAAAMRMADTSRTVVVDALRARSATDRAEISDMFMRRVIDPEGTSDKLRTDLAESGLLKGMKDSRGRRITVDERADRIARYEPARLAQDAHEQTAADIYFGGEVDPKQMYYLWFNPRDDRSQAEHAARHGHVMTAAEWDRREWGDGITGGPPLRPRCRCSRSFVMPHWFSKEDQKRSFEGDDVLQGVPEIAQPSTVTVTPADIVEPVAPAQPPIDLGSFTGQAAKGYGDYDEFVVGEHTDLHEAQQAMFGKVNANVTSFEATAVESYQGGGYRHMNGILRGTKLGNGSKEATAEIKAYWTPRVNAVKRIMSVAPPLERETYVYRHATFSNATATKMMGGVEPIPGVVFREKGFLSTSMGKTLLKFPETADKNEVDVMYRFRIRVPAGQRAIVMKPFGFEAEIMLPPGTNLRILSMRRAGTMRPYTKTLDAIEVEAEAIRTP